MLKKSALLSCGLQHHLCAHNLQINTSPPSLPPQRARPTSQTSSHGIFTDVRSSASSNFHDNFHWPKLPSASDIPTPYQIFQLESGAAYSKARFYDLVKIYHPDRNGHHDTHCGGISHSVKLERYRLIVLANEILSDPVKKQDYDNHGLGWYRSGRRSRHSHGYQGSQGRPFGTGPGCDNSPFRNATWEDWERWRYEREHPPAEKTYLSPNLFAAIMVSLAVLSGIAQGTWAGQYSTTLEEKIKTLNVEAGEFLDSRRDEQSAVAMDSADRVKWFLQKRDPMAYGLKPEEEEAYREAFSPRSISTATPSKKPDA